MGASQMDCKEDKCIYCSVNFSFIYMPCSMVNNDLNTVTSMNQDCIHKCKLFVIVLP